jgi:hypothetical protein
MTQRRQRGAVIVTSGHHTHGLIELLANPVRDRIDLAYYSHPYEIETELNYDFVIVLSLDDLRSVIKFYDAKRLLLPVIVHVDSPETLSTIRHDRLFPGVRILPIPQVGLDAEPHITLEINLFAQVLEL